MNQQEHPLESGDESAVTFNEIAELRRSQELFQLLVEVSSQIVWITDQTGTVMEDSPSWRSFTGQTVDQWMGFGWLEALHPEDRKSTIAAWEKSIRDSTPFTMEYRLRRHDGEYIWMQVRAVPQRNADGSIDRWVGMNSDISDRKQHQAEAAEREAHLRRVINHQLGLVGVIDRDGILVEIDDRSLEIAKVAREDVIGKHFAEAPWWTYDPKVAGKVHEAMRRAFAGEMVRFDVSLFSYGEDGVRIDFMIAPVTNDAGEIEYLIPSGIDIRDRHRAEVELKRAAARLDKSMSFAGIAAWGWDRKEQRLILDAPLKRMWGFDEDQEVTLADFTNRISPNHRERVVAAIRDSLQTFSSYREDYTIDLPSGNQRWIRAIGQTISDGKGGIGDFFGVTMDVTTDLRRQVKARVRAELLEQLSELTDPDAIMQLATRRIREHFAASRCYLARIRLDAQTTEVFYESHSDDLSPIVGTHQIADFLNEDEMRAIESGGPVRIDDISRSGRSNAKIQQFAALGIAAVTQGSFEATKTLHRTLFVTKVKPYHWRDDELRFLDNLTEMVYLRIERAESQLELEHARAMAEAASRSKSAFVANMSHEIRTPMTAILGYADLVRDMVTDPDAVEHLETIRRNGDYLLEIINDILDLSKIEAGKLEVNYERFEPARLMEDVRSIMEVRANEEGLALEVEYDGLLPKEIESDSKRLKQILINLVGNAIKFTKAGQVRIRVQFDRLLHIDIVDTGIGMSDEQQKRLFKPFSQGDASVTRTFGGTGLGLAISKRLTEMLGGTIVASSTEGVGSTFTVSVAVGDRNDVELVDYSAEFNLGKPVDGSGTDSSETGITRLAGDQKPLRCHVLVVDDRRDIRFLSRTLLTKAGATVDECEDGQLAVDYMTDHMGNEDCPDLILLDMQMPNLDGYETARTLRRLGYSGWIIALTADAMQGDMNECLEAGCNDYLSKPIDSNRMIELIAQFTTPRSD